MVIKRLYPKILLALLLALAAWPASGNGPEIAVAAENAYSLRQLEAAYLYKFLLFVRSPRPLSADKHLSICILGDASFADLLRPMADKKIRGSDHVLRVKSMRRDMREADLADCSLLFIGKKYKGSIDEILRRLRGLPILTVSDLPGFVQRGGMLGLVEKNGRLRWQINRRSVNEAGLTLASQLLRSAVMVVFERSDGGKL